MRALSQRMREDGMRAGLRGQDSGGLIEVYIGFVLLENPLER